MLYILAYMYKDPTSASIILCVKFGVPMEAMIP